MKLGTQTGSVINHLYSRATKGQPTPEVGMGVTLLSWTDRHAGTIQAVTVKGKALILEITEDEANVVKGSTFDGTAEYEYVQRPDSHRYMFRWNDAAGMWEEVGYAVKDYTDAGEAILSTRLSARKSGRGLRIGQREAYRDPSF